MLAAVSGRVWLLGCLSPVVHRERTSWQEFRWRLGPEMANDAPTCYWERVNRGTGTPPPHPTFWAQNWTRYEGRGRFLQDINYELFENGACVFGLKAFFSCKFYKLVACGGNKNSGHDRNLDSWPKPNCWENEFRMFACLQIANTQIQSWLFRKGKVFSKYKYKKTEKG